MSDRCKSLEPPEKSHIQDPGAHELAEFSSESDDHFSDAYSGPIDASSQSHSPSPIPKTRNEKDNNEPSYGEVPGTEAYRMREEDTEPDEISVLGDQEEISRSRIRLGSAVVKDGSESRSPALGGYLIPKTVLDETADAVDSVKHLEVKERRKMDPSPDLVLKTGDGKWGLSAEPLSTALTTPKAADSIRRFSTARIQSPPHPPPGSGGQDGDNDDFGDNFDDFEAGGDDMGDFSDFDDGFQSAEMESAISVPAPTQAPLTPSLSFAIPDFDEVDYEEILSRADPYLNALYPPVDDLVPPSPSNDLTGNPVFLTPRSASLWAQLVAPPPLQPTDWIRSRIRRLFLVSLGVPVDLDEILPASKQKKLVLPSVNLRGSPRTSTDSRRSATPIVGPAKFKSENGNVSSTSLDSQGKPVLRGKTNKGSGGKKATLRKSSQQEPSFELVAANQLCGTTNAALDGMTDQELRIHVTELEALHGTAKEVLEFWNKRTEEKIGDREAFEGVIENLVKHARKVRK